MDSSIQQLPRMLTARFDVSQAGRVNSHVSIKLLTYAMRLGDVVALVTAGLATCLLVHGLSIHTPFAPEVLMVLASTASALVALTQVRAYKPDQVRSLRRRLSARVTGALYGIPAILLCILLIPNEQVLFPVWPFAWFAFTMCLLGGGHVLFEAAVRHWSSSGRRRRRTGVGGVTDFSASFLNRVKRDGSDEIEIAGLFRDDEDGNGMLHEGYHVQGHISEIIARSARERIDAVVLAIPLTQPERIARAKQALACMIGDVYVTTGLAGQQFRSRDLEDLSSTPVVKLRPRPLTPWQALQKTVFDQVFGILILTALSPVLAFVAILIKLDSRGPIFFKQPRLGFNNCLFTVYKFRTMFHDQSDLLADRQTTRGDRRITRVGRVLRKLSLDELPQLINVTNGTMSIVGPRPHAPNTKANGVLFHDAVAEYALRHRVKPGITGWAQAHGWRGETSTIEQIEQRVAHDLYYIDNWSLSLDVKIILMTVKREIFSRTAF